MGNFIITIHGLGPHHNSYPVAADADRMAARFVYEMGLNGHKIDHASIKITDEGYRGGVKQSLLSEVTPPAQGPVAEQQDQVNAILVEQAIAEKPAE